VREQRLLADLENIFLAEGALRLTLAELATRLRCSKRALYQIAPSKEELFLRVLARNLEHIWQLGLEAEKRARTTEHSISEYVLAALIEVRKWSPAFLADIDAYGPARRMLDAHLDQRMRYLVHMIDEGIDRGRFHAHNSALVAEMLYASAMRFCSPAVLERAGLTLSQAVEQMTDVVCRGLVRAEARGTRSRVTALPAARRPGAPGRRSARR
jgi:AcrR family transcriptional regulator